MLLKNAFDGIDVNNDASLDTYELKALLEKLGEKPSEEMISKICEIADTDANGKISFDEFCKAILNGLEIGDFKNLNFITPSMQDHFKQLEKYEKLQHLATKYDFYLKVNKTLVIS